MSSNISDFSLFFMQKLQPQQKEGGGTMLVALELPTDRLQERRLQWDYFSCIFLIFYTGRLAQWDSKVMDFSSTDGFDIHGWARLGWPVEANLITKLLLTLALHQLI